MKKLNLMNEKNSMNELFIINGSACAGKDTFVIQCRNHLVENNSCRLVHNISSVDKVKEAASLLGWDGVKDERGRKFLSDLKDLSTVVYSGPFNYMKFCVEVLDGIIFFHIREPAEIAKFVRTFPQTKTIFIKRDSAKVPNNHADQEVDLYNYDFYIENDGTIEAYTQMINQWVKENL